MSNLFEYITDKTQHIPGAIGTVSGFYKNFVDMNNTPSMYNKDKYFHSKANFNAGQHYDFAPAIILDLQKENFDIPVKTWGNKKNGLSLKENIKDSMNDLGADFYGLMQGALHPFGKPQEYLKKYRPNELDSKY